jgi:gliding motility-associated-like protein
MNHLTRFLLLCCFTCLLSSELSSQQCSPIFQCGSLPVSGGTPPGSPTFFCEGDTVIIENNAQSDIDSTFIDWGDGMIDRFGGRANGSHVYDLIDTLCLSGGDTLVSIPITLTVLKKCPAGISRNCVITFVSIQVKPTVRFSNIDGLCVNRPIKFRNTTCQNGATATYLWTFDNGPTSTDKEPTYTFTTPGFHKVKLCATNNCGTTCVERNFLIREGASIISVATMKMPDPSCIPAAVTFTPTFKDVNDWSWSVLPPSGCAGCWEWVNSNGDSLEPTVRFTAMGDYIMRLIVWNECGGDTLDTQVPVYDIPTAAFAQPALSGCNTLTVDFGSNNLVSYSGSVNTYQWTFQGTTFSDQAFPVHTFNQSGIARLIVEGPCGNDTTQIAVNINQQIPVQFGPIPTPLCLSSDTFTIPVLVMQNPHLFSGPGVDPQTGLFNPSEAMVGDNTIAYTQGTPGCETSGTLTINILPGATVEVGDAVSICIDGGVYTIPFSPPGGQWTSATGPGIVDDMLGTFDPALAGAGPHELTYTFTDISGCISKKKKTITVVELPTLGVTPDTLSTCDIPGAIDLKILGMFSFSPNVAGSAITFSGPGVTADGMFTSPDTGLFQLNVNYSIPPGCGASIDFWIRVDSFIKADAGPDRQVCKSQGTLNLSGLPQGQGVWAELGGAPAIGSQTGTIDLATAASGDWQYRYTIRAGTPCESSDTISVRIEPSDGVQTGALAYFCETELTATLPAATPGNGVWFDGNGIPLPGNEVDISNLIPGEYAFTYTVASLPQACNTDTTRLVIVPDVNPAFSASHDTACIGTTNIQFTPAVAGQGQYEWDFGDNSSSNEESPLKTYDAPGDFTVTLTVRSINPITQGMLCENSSTFSVHVIAAPQLVAFFSTPTEGCAPLVVAFNNQSIVENGTYWWDFGNDTTYNGQNPGSITYLQGREDTTYTAKMFVTNGCDTVMFQQTILVKAQPTPFIDYSYLQPCSGDTLVLTNRSYGSPDSSFWRDSEGWVFIGQDPPIHKYFNFDSLPRVVTIWLTVKNECGTKTDSVDIVVNPADVFAAAFISDTTRVCLGDTVRLRNISPDGVPRWLDKNGQEWATPEIAVVASDTGLYWITLYVDGCGYDSVTLYYFVHPLPTLAVATPPVICPDMPATFSISSNAPATLFSFGTGDTTDLQLVEYVYPQGGNYNLWAQATSLVGCKAVWTGNIDVRQKPEAIPVVPDSVCSGVEIQLGGQQTGTNYTCIFLLPDGETADGCPTAYTFPQGGTFSIQLILVDSAGCRDTAAAPVYVRQSPVGGFTYNILSHCTPALVQFQSTASGATDVDWTTGDNGAYSTFSFEHTYQSGGVWPVTQTVTNEGLCPVTVTQTLKIDQTPVFDFTLDKHCTLPEGTDLSVNTAFENWVLVTGDTSGYEQAGDFHAGLLADLYSIYIKSPENCEHDTTLAILPINELQLVLKNNRDSFEINLGESVDLAAQVNQTGVSFVWINDLGDVVDTLPQTSVTPTRTTFFIVTATNAEGCFKMDTVYVKVLVTRDSVLVPNAFTPDASGKNDIFRIRTINTGIREIRSFRIWDKWGELMYEKEHFDPGAPHGWDGDFRGKKAEAGVYIYRIIVDYIDNFPDEKIGQLLLIR